MGTMYDLANKMASIAKAEGISVVLILRRDGSFQLTMADKKEDRLSEGTEETVKSHTLKV